ncbi:MAG TPA: HAMP domain-containing sensor histidine kinase, partial [Candidatus Dormibacteraeota bacterium]|nr:HAMP domain-containing sensor histidine kinase [Candidatus Dormibacteraeota bacterium]
DGLVLYTSNPALYPTHSIPLKERLYENLYELEQGYRSYSYKQPVFAGSNFVGIFQIELARDRWVAGVSNRSLLILGIFLAVFLLVYMTAAYLVNRKLNRRLTRLMDEMTAFASGEELQEVETNQDEIGELTRRFYDMSNEISESRKVIEKDQQEKEYMIATLSHDLKTPLTSIKAYAESLDVEQRLTELERQEYQKIIIEKSNFMKQMLDDLLIYTLMQSPTYEMEVVQVEGDEFFEMLVSDYEPLCQRKNLDLCAYADVTDIYEVNPKQMIRVVDNLVINAIQHTNMGGKIWLSAISDQESRPSWLYDFVDVSFHFKDNVYLIVQNEGLGIATDKLSEIFNPLFQEDQARSKRDDHGTGLGLSITKEIITRHGGDIQMYSKEGTGTFVMVELPKRKKGENNEFDQKN